MKAANLGITLGQPSLYVGHTNVLLLSGNDFPSQGCSEGHIEERHIWRYSDAGFFSDEGNNWQIIAMLLMDQGICNDICLPRMIMSLQIIVLDQLQPSSLVHVQIQLGEDTLQALVVSEDMNHIPKKIMPPCLQSKDNDSQLKIMRWIVLFIH
jgi:hypothetical protein